MASYLDTSFLVKLYIREEASDEAYALAKARKALFISSLVEVEMFCTMHRLYNADHAQTVLAKFRDDLQTAVFIRVTMGQSIFRRAQSLAATYSGQLKLRSLDAIHLATALHHGADEFATYDTRLAEAATLAGLNVIPSRS